MGGHKKIQSESEVKRWIEQGKTYAWMSEEYLRKYDLQVSPSMFSQFRRRNGLEGRQARDASLVPWAVNAEHRWANALQMLRAEARLRSGKDMPPERLRTLEVWKESLEEAGAVVHYEPDTEQGFFYVPKEDGEDLIRKPRKVTRERAAVE